jgi:hypothetical protein
LKIKPDWMLRWAKKSRMDMRPSKTRWRRRGRSCCRTRWSTCRNRGWRRCPGCREETLRRRHSKIRQKQFSWRAGNGLGKHSERLSIRRDQERYNSKVLFGTWGSVIYTTYVQKSTVLLIKDNSNKPSFIMKLLS